jgi:hypothetical protein
MAEPLNSRKDTRITIETHEIWVVRNSGGLIRRWCPDCQAEAEMIVLEETRVLADLPPAELEEWLNSQELHRLPAADGSLLVCLNSLLRSAPKKKDNG